MPIRVHVACDDPSYRDAIASILSTDENIEIADTSREAGIGTAAVENVRPDVVVLAVPPAENVASHAREYRASAPADAGLVGFCIFESQAEGYRTARVDEIVFSGDTPARLCEAIRRAARARK